MCETFRSVSAQNISGMPEMEGKVRVTLLQLREILVFCLFLVLAFVRNGPAETSQACVRVLLYCVR